MGDNVADAGIGVVTGEQVVDLRDHFLKGDHFRVLTSAGAGILGRFELYTYGDGDVLLGLLVVPEIVDGDRGQVHRNRLITADELRRKMFEIRDRKTTSRNFNNQWTTRRKPSS